MAINLEIFKKHPYVTAVGAVIIFLGVYLMLKNKSASNTTASTPGSSAYDAQLASLQAAQNTAQLQASTQLQVAGLQAGVQNNTVNAQAQTANLQTEAQLAAIEAQTAAAVKTNATDVGGQIAVSQIQANAATASEQLLAQQNITQVNDLAAINQNIVNNQTLPKKSCHQ